MLSGIVTGVFEGIITIIIGTIPIIPKDFVSVSLFVNMINQFGRYQKYKDNDELGQFYGISIITCIVLFFIK